MATHTYEKIKILDIYLDKENSRHDVINDQALIIEHLIKKESVRPLAKHIATHGLNPTEVISVIKHNGHYIAVEGNRRLCALILLNDPNKYQPTEKEFNKLAQPSNLIPNEVLCIVFDKREDAYVWAGIKHSGEQGGIGTKQWSPEGKQRHNLKTNKKDPNALAIGLIEYAVQTGILPKFPESRRILTTASRYLGNPFFRQTIGIVSTKNNPDILTNASSSKDLNRVLKRFMDDLIENTTVNSRSKKTDWAKYAQLLSEKGITPKLQPNAVLLSDLQDNSKPQDDNLEDQGVKPNSSDVTPDRRPYIVGSDFKVNIKNQNLKRAFGELTSINAENKPLATALVCRSFLEFLYRLVHEKLFSQKTQAKTHIVMRDLVQHIKKDNNLSKAEKAALKSLNQIASNKENQLSPQALGLSAHNLHYPDHRQMKRDWDNISHILKYMIQKI